MSRVRVLVGTRKGAFVLTADGKRDKWDVSGPFFPGWKIYHVAGRPPTRTGCSPPQRRFPPIRAGRSATGRTTRRRGKSPRPLAGPRDYARAISAEHHRECRRRLPPGARGKRGIHRVHARGPHPEQHLSRSRFRRRYLAHHRDASVFTDVYSAHGDLLANRSSQTAVHAAHAGWHLDRPLSRQAGTFLRCRQRPGSALSRRLTVPPGFPAKGAGTNPIEPRRGAE